VLEKRADQATRPRFNTVSGRQDFLPQAADARGLPRVHYTRRESTPTAPSTSVLTRAPRASARPSSRSASCCPSGPARRRLPQGRVCLDFPHQALPGTLRAEDQPRRLPGPDRGGGAADGRRLRPSSPATSTAAWSSRRKSSTSRTRPATGQAARGREDRRPPEGRHPGAATTRTWSPTPGRARTSSSRSPTSGRARWSATTAPAGRRAGGGRAGAPPLLPGPLLLERDPRPRTIVLTGPVEEAEQVTAWLEQRRGGPVTLEVPSEVARGSS